MGESLLAMYRHQTTCEPPRPSLGRRIDLSEYRDPNFLQNLPQPTSPVSMGQTTALSSSPSSSLPPVMFSEPAVLLQNGTQPQITPSQTTVEVTTSAPPVGQLYIQRLFFLIPLFFKKLKRQLLLICNCILFICICLQLQQWTFL